MTNFAMESSYCSILFQRSRRALIGALALVALVINAGCLFKRSAATPTTTPTQARLALLPFNVPAANKEMQWMAFAAPALLAKATEYSKDLELIPLSETMQAAKDTAGQSRSFNEETSGIFAGWVAAKWAVMGELSPVKGKPDYVAMIIDFVPSKDTLVPFRYLKTIRKGFSGTAFQDACIQFSRYIGASLPIQPRHKMDHTLEWAKDAAEALERDYGWFGDATPGKAQETVAELAASDEKLAQFLFSPTLYPALASQEKSAPAKKKK